MNQRRGFTLVEMAIALAVVAILAAVAAAAFPGARRNASVGSTAFDLAVRLQGLKTKAMDDQRNYVYVLANPAGDVSTGCGLLSQSSCFRWFLLYDPTTAWTLSSFDVANPGTNISVEDTGSFPAGVVLDVAAAGTASPAPFATVKQLDTHVLENCNGSSACLAIRFSANGEVVPVYASGQSGTLQGVAFGLATDTGTERRALLVTFPTGLVKSSTYLAVSAH
jgi:prepilin-type N-terminal cleavage/methylation domain-containing protein